MPKSKQLDQRPARRRHDEHIVRLEIAVHHATLVRRLEPGQHLDGVVERDVRRQLLVALENGLQAVALKKLHHQVGKAPASP